MTGKVHEGDCYRVRITLGARWIDPIIVGASPEDAIARARVIGEDLLRKVFPWEIGHRRPSSTTAVQLLIGTPRYLHSSAHGGDQRLHGRGR